MTLKQLFDKINGTVNKWLSAIDKWLEAGNYQPSNNEPTQYS